MKTQIKRIEIATVEDTVNYLSSIVRAGSSFDGEAAQTAVKMAASALYYISAYQELVDGDNQAQSSN